MGRNPKKNRPPKNSDLRSQQKETGEIDRCAATGKIHVRNRFAAPVVCGFLLLAVVLVYGRTIRHEFINYDDNVYVYDNTAIKDGVTWKAVAWSFTTFEGSNWHPVTWLSHILDCQMFGLRPAGHHAVNVAFHIINSILLYILLLRMTASQWRSAMVAVLFALHPLHVESVAWVAERKDVLSTMFAMLTMLAYLHYVSRPSVIRYVLMFVLLALGLMSKPMLVTIPFVLLLLDYWPLGRWVYSPPYCPQLQAERQTALWLMIEKLPLMVLAAASSAVTCVAQQAAIMTRLSLPIRLANALVSYVSYLGKTLWPHSLIVFYPYEINLPWWQPAAAAILLIVVTGLAIWLWRRRPYLIVGWLWYLGTLLPVIGLVQVGRQSMADRYTYIPLIGIFIMGVWGVADIASPWRNRRIILGFLAGIVTLACMIVTFRQVAHWIDSRSLFEYVLSITPNIPLAHNNLGNVLIQAGRPEEAIEHYEQALRLDSNYPLAHDNLGNALIKTGRVPEAIEHYRQALRLKPDYAKAYFDLANAFATAGDYQQAIENFRQALRLKSNYFDAHNNLGDALLKTGRTEEAIEHYRQALRLKPNFFEAQYNLGNALLQIGRLDAAIEYYKQAIRLKPDSPEAHINLGNAFRALGQYQQAIEYYEQALRLKPDYAEAYNNLGSTLVQIGRVQEAIEHYRQALRLNPDLTSIYSNLALAYAEMRQSAEAVAAAEKALDLARTQGQTALAKQIEDWLNSYHASLSDQNTTPPSQSASPTP